MRIPSGVTDQYIYFVAVDASDLVTRETGLSSFTVYRSRNGGTATAYTTPTISELSSSNMPGVYELLLDEDMTIDSGDDSQEVCLHITHAGMAPVTRVFELYRPSVTAGQTLNVASGIAEANVKQFGDSNGTFSSGRPEVNTTHAAGTAWGSGAITPGSIASNAITDAKIASGAFTAAKFASGAFDAVWAVATRLLTAGTNIALAKGTGITGFNDLSQADVRTAVGLASANLDTQLDALPTAAENASAVMASNVEGTVTLTESMRLQNAVLLGKASGLATTTATYRDLADTKDRVVATVDANGNRSAVTLDDT